MQKILIIEDEQILRQQIVRLLQLEGFEAMEATNGRIGVELAIKNPPDLIICDILMPELDGFGVLQSVRENARTAMIPFIFLTALVGSPDRRHGMEEGADDYITKPYTPASLIGSVRRRLEKRRLQLEENRRRAEEVSLAVAASVPREFMEKLDHIMTVTNLLVLKYGGQDPQVSEMQKSVAQESGQLRRLLRRLHFYAQLPQLYASRFELLKAGPPTASGPVLGRVAREVCQAWQREPDLILTSEPAQLPMREEYLVMLVEELVENACKFSPPGTPLEVAGFAQDTFWSLQVSNHGSGLSAEQIASIGAFKQFWSGSQKPRGLGLGLALSQGIARLHGSEFVLLSNPETTSANVLVPLET